MTSVAGSLSGWEGPHVVSQLQKGHLPVCRSLLFPSDFQLLQGLVLIAIRALASTYLQLSLAFTHCRRPSFKNTSDHHEIFFGDSFSAGAAVCSCRPNLLP